jgi:hypothetical protein
MLRALMKAANRWIEEMPMIAIASFTFSTVALTCRRPRFSVAQCFGVQSPIRRRVDVKKRFSEEQIIGFLGVAEAGMPVKELEDENRRLKKMYADAQLSADLLKEALSKKW